MPLLLKIPVALTAWGVGLYSFVKGLTVFVEFFGL